MEAGARGQAARIRLVVGIAGVVLVLAYTVGVVLGRIREANRLDFVDLAFLVCSVLLLVVLVKPEVLNRLRFFAVGGFKLEMEAVRQKQAEQATELEDLRLILTLLLPSSERKHLVNLARRATEGYVGRSSLRTELRRLRSMGLVEMLPSRMISGIENDAEVDIGDYVELTEFGRSTLARIREVEEPARGTAEEADR